MTYKVVPHIVWMKVKTPLIPRQWNETTLHGESHLSHIDKEWIMRTRHADSYMKFSVPWNFRTYWCKTSVAENKRLVAILIVRGKKMWVAEGLCYIRERTAQIETLIFVSHWKWPTTCSYLLGMWYPDVLCQRFPTCAPRRPKGSACTSQGLRGRSRKIK